MQHMNYWVAHLTNLMLLHYLGKINYHFRAFLWYVGGSEMSRFYSAAALLAMQSAVLATAIPSVRPSIRHTLVMYWNEW